MSRYRAIYKCPLCGGWAALGKAREVPRGKLGELMGEVVKRQQFAANQYLLDVPPMQMLHECGNGSVGLARFAGFEIDESKPVLI